MMEKNEIPQPPAPLSDDGEKLYNEIAEYLQENAMLQHIDANLIYQAAIWWEQYLAAVYAIREHGAVQVAQRTGFRQISPEVTILKQSQAALNVLFKKLGIGEDARQKLRVMSGGGGYDPMDDL